MLLILSILIDIYTYKLQIPQMIPRCTFAVAWEERLKIPKKFTNPGISLFPFPLLESGLSSLDILLVLSILIDIYTYKRKIPQMIPRCTFAVAWEERLKIPKEFTNLGISLFPFPLLESGLDSLDLSLVLSILTDIYIYIYKRKIPQMIPRCTFAVAWEERLKIPKEFTKRIAASGRYRSPLPCE